MLAVLVLLTAVVMPAYASTTGIISGVVTDADTGAALSGVNIMVKGTYLTTVTDANGYFVITNVPPGAFEVKASLVGYGTLSRNEVSVLMDTTSSLEISLVKVEQEETTKQIVRKKSFIQPNVAPTMNIVQAKQEQMSKNQPNNLYQIPGIVSTQPGVVVDGEGRPHIRGGRDNQVGYMLEGIPVIEPLTNVFGTNTVTVGMSKMQIYTGGYRAEYGNAISGVFNEIKKTGSECPGGRLEMTGGGQSYMGSYLEYGGASPSGLDYYVGSYLWQTDFRKMPVAGCESADTIGKFVYPVGKNDKLTLLLNQGSARYRMDAIHDFTYQNQPVPPEEDHSHQGYSITGLTWSHNFSSSSFMTLRPYVYNTRAILDALSPDGWMSTYLNYGTRQKGIQAEYTNQLNPRHLLKTGASVTRSKNHYLAWVPDLGPMLGFPEWGDYAYSSDVDTTQTGIYIQDQAQIGNKWHLEAGVRYDGMHFDKVENPDISDSQISPRFGATYKLSKNNVLKTSWGRFIQFPPSYVMERVYDNPDWNEYRLGSLSLKPERSTSWDISWERQLNSSTFARLTPFTRTYTDLLQSRRVNINDPDSMTSMYINSGEGKSNGVELFMQKRMNSKWDGWLSYTWMKSRANASDFTAPIDPEVMAYCDWDQRHTLNLVASYKTKKWVHDWQLSFGSGLADTVYAGSEQFQSHAPRTAILSWNMAWTLPERLGIGETLNLNIWNIFNVGKANQYIVFPDGSKEETSWVMPRFITLGINRSF